jgi:hypothetical protein
MNMNMKYEVGSRYDMRIEQHGAVIYKIVTISKITKDGCVIIDSNPALKFRPDGREIRPIDPTVIRQLKKRI